VKTLAPAAAARLTDAFLASGEAIDVAGLVTETGRAVRQDEVAELAQLAQDRFADEPTAADPWMAVRLHSLLRLTRREAANKDFWLHLAIVDSPAYVRWRWGPTASRYTAGDVNQALSRLWWAAELFREGSDFSAVERAFSPPDIPNTIMRLRAAHSRPFCVGFLQFVALRRSDNTPLIGRQVNRLSSAINSQLFVAALDSVAPDAGCDHEAAQEWRGKAVTMEQLRDEVQMGPDDLGDPQFAGKVAAVIQLLHRIADGAGIATAEDPTAGSERPSDTPAKEPAGE